MFISGLLIIIGIITIIFSVSRLKKFKEYDENKETEYINKFAIIRDESIDNIYMVYDDINNSGKRILENIDAKYNDLVVLYDMISKKSKEINEINEISVSKKNENISTSLLDENEPAVIFEKSNNDFVAIKNENNENLKKSFQKKGKNEVNVKNEEVNLSHLENLINSENEAVFLEKEDKSREKLEDKLFTTLKESAAKQDVNVKNDINNDIKSDIDNLKNKNQKNKIKKNKSMNFDGNKKAQDVLKLKEDGLNSTEIAKTLNMGKGEVELILGLGGK
ncbi:MAG: DUF6115 domain-containing protein [Lachnospirales bacterium]